MLKVTRSPENPILLPNPGHTWETEAAFNGCVIYEGGVFHMTYRALSSFQSYFGSNLKLSTIGHAVSGNGIHFTHRYQLIKPEFEWELFGCEDPRITKLNGKYFIFYTALSTYPFTPSGIKIGVATTRDFQTIEEKHPVTFFNSKAMSLFPEKIDGKIVGILTAHTDMPPAKIGLIFFEKESDIWNQAFWENWYASLDSHVLTFQRSPSDHVEMGAPPLKTKEGWLLIYCYIRNYFSGPRTFGIEALLLDLKDPTITLGRTEYPLLVPEKNYELYGSVPDVIFPSGALIHKKDLYIYYGATDTTCCLATVPFEDLLTQLSPTREKKVLQTQDNIRLERFEDNPIISPILDHPWESRYTFNPAAVYEGEKVHIIYRAMGENDVSSFGYASSTNGYHLEERLPDPIYTPREDFEKKGPVGNAGCEDPRITRIGDRLYLCYTAYDGKNPPRVALSSISVSDFLKKEWSWEKPELISPPKMDDKDACIFPEKIRGKYAVLHRIAPSIWVDFVAGLTFGEHKWLRGEVVLEPRKTKWDSDKIGIGGPPLKTKEGWLLIYHGLSLTDKQYRLGAVLLDLENPGKVISQLDYPILEPEAEYENEGLRPGTVFACGNVVIGGRLFVYYGGADQFVCVASTDLRKLLAELKRYKI